MAKKRRRKSEIGGDLDPNGWMLTFSDLLTLLLTFFVLLISMSSIDMQCLKTAFSFFGGGAGALSLSDRKETIAIASILNEKKPLNDLQSARLSKFFKEEGILVRQTERGMAVSFQDSILFDPGKAEIKDGCRPLLKKVAGVLRFSRYCVSIEGHTDDIPIHTERFPSNWELSLARTLSILQHFIDQEGINPRRLRVAGYGDSKTLYPNDSEEHRSANRRVEILFIT